jgi:hypothetical protein
MRAPTIVALAAAIVATAFFTEAGASAPQAGGWYEDDRYGYKLKPPKDWQAIPMQSNEGWQIAKWLSDRSYFYTDPDLGWTYEQRPTCKVIAFVTEIVRERARAKKVKDENERIKILIENPYTDYKDYLRRTYKEGGWFVQEETEAEVNGLKVTKLYIKVEKLSYDGPKRIETWIYHTPEVDFAVEFEVLQTEWDKLGRTVKRTLKSFEEIARSEAGLPAASTGAPTAGGFTVTETSRETAMTPKERAERRRQLEEAEHRKAIETLPDDWEHEQHGRILVLNHSRAKVGQQRALQAQAVLDWLDKTLPFIGPEEYVRAPIIRICKDYEEEASFRKGGAGSNWGGMGTEITGHNDDSGKIGYETEWLNKRVLEIWFQDRDRELYWALPEWLDYGLREVIGASSNKRGKITFRVDDYEREGVRERGREGTLTPVQDLMRKGNSEFHQQGDYRIVYESQSLVRFFLCGDASKSAATRDVLPDYLRNLKEVIEEIKAGEKDKGNTTSRVPATEEEEEEFFRAQRQAWKQRERSILDETFERTFGSWTSRDWGRFEKAYKKAAL